MNFWAAQGQMLPRTVGETYAERSGVLIHEADEPVGKSLDRLSGLANRSPAEVRDLYAFPIHGSLP